MKMHHGFKNRSYSKISTSYNMVCPPVHRGSYMGAHVLMNLLNELGKRDEMRGLPSILSLFRNEFNKFNTTGARLDRLMSSISYVASDVSHIRWRLDENASRF